MIDPELIRSAVPLLLQGAKLTVLISLVGILIGLPFGVAVGRLRASTDLRWLMRVADGYSALFRGTPMLVQIFVLYYGLSQIDAVRHTPAIWWLIGDSMRCAMLAVVLNTVAYTSEIFRTAFRSVPTGLVEAALACGMSRTLTLLLVRLPLAVRHALPAYGNEVAIIVKESSLASTITVLEITGYAKRLMSETFAIIEIFAMASALYLAINLSLLALVRVFERRLRIPGHAPAPRG